MKSSRYFFYSLAIITYLFTMTSCQLFRKQIPTGSAFPATNVYANVSYDHSKLQNVYLLPVDNPFEDPTIEMNRDEFAKSLLRNFAKYHFFHIDYDKFYPKNAERVIDLSTGKIDRFKIGYLSKEHNAQAVMKVSIDEYQPFFPMRIRVKAMLIDSSSGERIWAFDEVFDSDDANVVNGMRYWWNAKKAGGFSSNRFSLNVLRPEFFTSYAFDTMADSYGRARVANVETIINQRTLRAKKAEEIKQMQKQVYE
jgi:TolB-like protein